MKILDKKSTLVLMLLLLMAALAIRFVVLMNTFETGGDGPARAVWGYAWSKSPYLILQNVWLPGWVYLTGVVNLIVSDPVNAGRLLNVVLGSLTIPAFYALVRRLFDPISAVISAVTLTVLPIHVSHSATTFGEVPLVFGAIAGMLFAILASETTTRKAIWYLCAAFLTCTIATSTRFEAWLLVPALPAFYYLQTRKLLASSIFFVALMLFPAFWMISNYLPTGELLESYFIAIETPVTTTLSFVHTALMLLRSAANAVGSPMFIAGLGGLILTLAAAAKRTLTAGQWLYLFVTCVIGIFTVKFGFDRGTWMFSRYYIFGATLLLPYSAIVFTRYLGSRPRTAVIAVAVAVLSSVIHMRPTSTDYNVTDREPVEFQRLATWLNDSACKDDAVLMTTIAGRAWYLLLYDRDIRFTGRFPQVSPQYMIVDYWASDDELRSFLEKRHPALLITSDLERDRPIIERIETFTGETITEDELVHTEQYLKVYELTECGKASP